MSGLTHSVATFQRGVATETTGVQRIGRVAAGEMCSLDFDQDIVAAAGEHADVLPNGEMAAPTQTLLDQTQVAEPIPLATTSGAATPAGSLATRNAEVTSDDDTCIFPLEDDAQNHTILVRIGGV